MAEIAYPNNAPTEIHQNFSQKPEINIPHDYKVRQAGDLGTITMDNQMLTNSYEIVEALSPSMEWFKKLAQDPRFIKFTSTLNVFDSEFKFPNTYGPNFQFSGALKNQLNLAMNNFLSENPDLLPPNLDLAKKNIDYATYRMKLLLEYNARKTRRPKLPGKEIIIANSAAEVIKNLRTSFPKSQTAPTIK